MSARSGARRLRHGAQIVLLVLALVACRELEPRQGEEGSRGSSGSASGGSAGTGSSGAAGSTGGASSSGSSSSGSSSSGSSGADAGALAAGDHTVGPEARPATLTVPARYSGQPLPLVLLLHGTSESPESVEAYLRMKPVAEARGFFLLRPGGEPNAFGYAAWNATDSCCSYRANPPDDSGYLSALVEQVGTRFALDSARIYAVGHSSGGFMAYRLACDHAEQFAGIVSFAGATYQDARACTPSEGVHVLQVHGTSDRTVVYGGGSFGIYGSYPGAETSVARWAGYNGCAQARTAAGTLDLLAAAGDDTDVGAHEQCPAGASAELWAMRGADHMPALSSSFADSVAEWLLARSKP